MRRPLLHAFLYLLLGACLFFSDFSLSLHVALQLNWILVAALEDYHAEMPDGSKNKKANTVYFNRCAKLLQVCRTAGGRSRGGRSRELEGGAGYVLLPSPYYCSSGL